MEYNELHENEGKKEGCQLPRATLVVMVLSLSRNEAEIASSGPDSTRECGRRDPRSHTRGAFKPFLYKCSGPHTVTESFLLRLSSPPGLGRAIAIRQPHDYRSTEI